jgi:hypothetical protein
LIPLAPLASISRERIATRQVRRAFSLTRRPDEALGRIKSADYRAVPLDWLILFPMRDPRDR